MKKNNKTPADPHASREAKKYDNPIASREYILETLENADGPLNKNQLARLLKVSDVEQVDALRRRLRAMERDGQLMRNRKGAYGLPSKMDLVTGRVQAHRDGYGFVIPEEGGEDLFINGKQMSTVFDGDIVLCRAGDTDHRGKREGVIVDVIKRNTTQVVGRLYRDGGVIYVVPDNNRITHDIFIAPEDAGSADIGEYVVVELLTQPAWRVHPTGKVIEVLGQHMAPGMEIDVAIRSHDIPHVWPDGVLAEAAKLDDEPVESDKEHRIDLRELPFVTIDGEDARDFDDAVYCEAKAGGGWRLWVAIADVSHYVQCGSALDQEAVVRGNSVYFPERVIPMLPEALSNGLCSLKPDVDRLAMICEMTISATGKLSGFYFYEGVIHSHARLTYTKVGAMLNEEHAQYDELTGRYADLMPHIKDLHGLYKALRQARTKRGAIDFETTETRIVFGADKKIETIIPVERNDAHKLIEECMLCANVATAKFLEKHEVPALYRVHEGPSEEKLANLRAYLAELGFNLPGQAKPSPTDYQALMEQIAERPDASVIQTMMLRSLSQAVYQPDNLGHFGLSYDGYTHFTSPIRRYPDLLVHRAIRHVIRSQQESKHVRRVDSAKPLSKKTIYPYDMPALLGLGEQCSMTERRADDATRDVVAWLKCEYLQEHVGDTFGGVISAVTGFGFFVELTDIYVEGLVHVSALDRDYYHFEPAKQRLVGERAGRTFHLGDEVQVQVVRVSLEDKKIDLELVDSGGGRRRKASSSKKSKVSPVNKQGVKKAKSLKSAKKTGKKSGGKKSTAKKNKKAKLKAGAKTTVAQVRKRKKSAKRKKK